MNRCTLKWNCVIALVLAVLLGITLGVPYPLVFGDTSSAGAATELKDFQIMQQPDEISCGPTCCSMVLKYYGKSAGIGPLKTKAGTRVFENAAWDVHIGMTTPEGVRNALEAYGLSASVKRGSTNDLINLIDKKRPPILLVRSGTKLWHYVVATGYRHPSGGSNSPLEIRLSDPSGDTYWIDSSRLNGSWQFSHDLDGHKIEGRRCRTCGGNGKVGQGWTKCVVCSGTGKVSLGPIKSKCRACSGQGKWSSAGTKCPMCDGDGRETDFFRKVVETSGVSGHTYIAVNHRTGGGGSSSDSSEGKASSIARIEYNIRNDSGHAVKFRLPTGKIYSLQPGEHGNYKNTGSPDQLTMYVFDSHKSYKLKSGNHRFWWKGDERRIAFDLNYDSARPPSTKPSGPAKPPYPGQPNSGPPVASNSISCTFTNRTPEIVSFRINGGRGLSTNLAAGKSATYTVAVNSGTPAAVFIRQKKGSELSFSLSDRGTYMFQIQNGKIVNAYDTYNTYR